MNFAVLWADGGDDVILVAEFEKQRVLGVLTRAAIEDDCEPAQTGLSLHQRKMVAECNIKLLSDYLHGLCDGPMALAGSSETPRITIRTGDLRAAGIRLSPRILAVGSLAWADPQTGKF